MMERATLAQAWGWIDAQPAAPIAEDVSLAEAAGRLLAAPVISPIDWPPAARAVIDGYAVRAADCDGASDYNPLTPAAAPIAAGWPMPPNTDAVLPPEAAQPTSRGLEVFAPVARGAGILPAGGAWTAGTLQLPDRRRLRPPDLACLALIGLTSIAVLRRPRIALAVPGPKSGHDALTPLVRALLARDGIHAEPIRLDALANLDADALLIAGRSGDGPDDDAATILRDAGGRLAVRGVALRPGDSVSLGQLGRIPVVLLPGDPAACLSAYDMVAARLLRRLAGADPAPPHAVMDCRLDRKIASPIGLTDIVPVRVRDGRAVPLPTPIGADGFIVIADSSEGAPAGARVTVYLYGAS
jgi:molybdopterin molybdotransferase